jgi:hypothetical protein
MRRPSRCSSYFCVDVDDRPPDDAVITLIPPFSHAADTIAALHFFSDLLALHTTFIPSKMRAVALSLAVGAARSAPPPMPTVPICMPDTMWNPSAQCYNMCVAATRSHATDPVWPFASPHALEFHSRMVASRPSVGNVAVATNLRTSAHHAAERWAIEAPPVDLQGWLYPPHSALDRDHPRRGTGRICHICRPLVRWGTLPVAG